MKNECNIIRDILPLYREKMVSADTSEFIEEHLKNCSECRKECDRMKEPKVMRSNADILPLTKLKQKLRTKRIKTIVFTAILVTALLVSAFAVMDAPEYFPYFSELVSITENADKSITITFDEIVTDYQCSSYSDTSEEGRHYYQIEAWTSLWDRWFSMRGAQSTTIQAEEHLPFSVYYVSNNGQENVCIYGQELAGDGGMISLPRLSPGYYLILAALFLGVMLVIWFAVKNKSNIKIWVERIILYPASYIIGHTVVLGFDFASYSFPRDFALIIFLSILIYCGLLLGHSIYRLRREIKEMSRY